MKKYSIRMLAGSAFILLFFSFQNFQFTSTGKVFIDSNQWVTSKTFYHLESRSKGSVLSVPASGTGVVSDPVRWSWDPAMKFQYYWSQMWEFVPLANAPGYFWIRSRWTGQCIDSHVSINAGRPRTIACHPDYHSSHFRLSSVNTDESLFFIVGRHTGKCLQADPTTSVTSQTCNSTYWDQQWWITAASADVRSNLAEFNQLSYRLARPQAEGWVSPIFGPTTGNQHWLFSSTNETATFMPYESGAVSSSMSSLRAYETTRTLWVFDLYPRPEASTSGGVLAMALDKVNHPMFLDAYTGAFVNDSFDINSTTPRPAINENLVVELQVALKDFQRKVDPLNPILSGKSRLVVAITLRDSTGYTYFLEVNLTKDSEFDLCRSNINLSYGFGNERSENCDPNGIYDRRSNFGTGELLYYDGLMLGKIGVKPVPNLRNDQNFHNVRIPISELFRKSPWVRLPANLSDVKIAGIYIGPEIWGRGRIWYEMRRYRLYRDE